MAWAAAVAAAAAEHTWECRVVVAIAVALAVAAYRQSEGIQVPVKHTFVHELSYMLYKKICIVRILQWVPPLPTQVQVSPFLIVG